MNTTEKITAVTTHCPDTDERVLRRCEIGSVAHQGDVYLHRVAADRTRGKPWGSRQVAIGTQTGSRHVANGNLEVFAGVTAADLLPLFNADQQAACLGPVIVAQDTWTLDHPEHATHRLPAGTYQVTYQWDAASMARVAD